jgi:glycerol-3-phosphate dehydrogenase
VLHDHKDDKAAQVISVIGGRLSTAGTLARECAERVGVTAAASRLSVKVVDGEAELDPLLGRWVTEIAQAGSISEASARSIVEWHGRRSTAIAHMALSSAELRAPLCSHSEHIVAEALDAFSNEYAITLADVLLRRVPVALGGCWSQACSREAAARVGAVMGWNDQQTAGELEIFETERETFLRRPQPGFALETAAD